jgi:hypothetical protein
LSSSSMQSNPLPSCSPAAQICDMIVAAARVPRIVESAQQAVALIEIGNHWASGIIISHSGRM